ncbi:MAG TPA: SIMPL domain-containing protein [Methanocorpusculum sp.]|nr:SIMPL domain-containing protein [Methanocorpusculum sp.]
MKRQLCIASLILVAAVLAFAVPAVADTSMTDKIISVTGYGESETTPDVATISLGLTTENTNAAKAQAENKETMDKIISALKSAGVSAKEISTRSYSIYSYTVSEYDAGKYPAGTVVYKVTNLISVKTSNVDSVGSYIDAAVSAGANVVNSIVFSLSNEKYIEQRNLALTSAVKGARADADAVASALGLSIKGTGVVNVDQSYTPVSYANVAYDAVAVPMTAKMTSGAGSSTAIESGTLKTTATVSVTYTY